MIDYKDVLGSLFDIVHITDAEGKTLYCSERYGEFFGIDPAEMIGKPIEDFYRQGYFTPMITMRVIRERKRFIRFRLHSKNASCMWSGRPSSTVRGACLAS